MQNCIQATPEREPNSINPVENGRVRMTSAIATSEVEVGGASSAGVWCDWISELSPEFIYMENKSNQLLKFIH